VSTRGFDLILIDCVAHVWCPHEASAWLGKLPLFVSDQDNQCFHVMSVLNRNWSSATVELSTLIIARSAGSDSSHTIYHYLFPTIYDLISLVCPLLHACLRLRS
jgi:hypothetical protein